MDRSELAWAAGFWDGEGSAWLSRSPGHQTWQPFARINQSSVSGIPEVLIRFERAVGFGTVQGPDLKEGKEPLYRWVVSSREGVSATCTALEPWLGQVKRRQFARVLGMPVDPGRDTVFADPEERLAWSAGLFDGEGSVYLAKHQSHMGYFLLEASVTQSSWHGAPEVLVLFHEIVGIGKIYGPYPGGEGHAPVYRWKAHRRGQIEAMITSLSTQLGHVKRDQAAAAMKQIAAQIPLPRGNPAWGNRKTHCVHGHEYATARIRPFRGRGKNDEAPRDSHQCLACVREYARAKRIARKMQNRA